MSFPVYPIALSLRGSCEIFSCGSSCSQIGKHINLGLMRFTVHVQSISMPQCVEDMLLVCRGAD